MNRQGAAITTLSTDPTIRLQVPRVAGASMVRPSRRGALLLVSTIVLGLLLRLIPLRGLWLDEAISVEQARAPYWQMIAQLRAQDVHPPAWATVLWLDTHVFGYGLLAVRIPSTVFGVISIPLAYLVGSKFYDRRAGLAAAVLFTVSPLAVWYSGESRMYALYILLSLLAMLAQASILLRPTAAMWILFALSSAALFYTQYFSAFQICAQNLIFLAVIGRRAVDRAPVVRSHLVPWLLSAILAFVLIVPLIPYLYSQVSVSPGPSGGGTPAGWISLYTVLANLVWASWGYHSDEVLLHAVALWPFVMLGILILLGKGRSRSTNSLAVLVIVPLAIVYVLGSQISSTMFEIRYFISIVPPILLLLGRAVTAWARGTIATATALALVSGTMLVGLADEQFDSTNPRLYDYGSAFAVVREEAEPGDQLIYAPDFLAPVVTYYQPPVEVTDIAGQVPVDVDHHRKVFLLASFLEQPDTASAVGARLADLEQAGMSVKQTVNAANATVWVLQ